MFDRIRSRVQDVATIAARCRRAEAHALQDRQPQPGAEHFLLAALDLGERTARQAFRDAGADPDGFGPAIGQHYATALSAAGLAIAAPAGRLGAPARHPDPASTTPRPPGRR